MIETPAWERRFTAPQIRFPVWSNAAPHQIAHLSNESGSWQVWALDLDSGARRQVTEEEVDVETVLLTPDGRIVWWRDDTGDERGRWMTVPFDGTDPTPLVPGAPYGWAEGISFAAAALALGIGTESGYRILVEIAGEVRELWRSERPLGLGAVETRGAGGISADGRLVCANHTEHGDIVHRALRVFDAENGGLIGDLQDPDSNLEPVAWSPILGDDRLLFTSELAAFERPAIWRPREGERRDLPVELPGAAIPLGWWPDGSAILIRHEFEGTFQLYRIELDDDRAALIADPPGEITEGAVRPDGTVWFATSDSVHPPRIVDTEGREVMAPPGDRPPEGHPSTSFWFENPHGHRIQAIVLTPPGDGPYPTVMSVHGGPEWHDRDAFDAETLAFVDAGFAVAMVNYRGSTGYGVAFRRALVGNPWFPETEDVIAGLDALIAERITDPERVAFSGWSWGGCLACLNAGLHPDRWRAVFAGIPSADFVAAHEACMPELQAYDVALYGGTPAELPEMYAERNPMTYVDRARAPVLIIAGEQDPRCPIEGITPWVDALRAYGVPVEVHLYPEGHHASGVEARVRHMRLILDFFARYV